ncbi:MAG TPA: GNAT family N-acetyltransferase [Deltaproteobacteria bacterium]|nr:GNAT family N-acetyltransferase [Deltaproteobacteria bacterium]
MANIEIVEYNPEMQKLWDDFVWNSRNGTIFHTQRFLAYHPPGRFRDCSLLFHKKNRIACVLPGALTTKSENLIYRSHPGSSYGGPVLAFDTDLRFVIEALEIFIYYLSQRGFHSIEMRLPPRVYQRYPSGELDFALTYLGFKVVNMELSTAIYLNDKKNWWKRFRDDTARSIRKALKTNNLTVKETDDWAHYWKVLTDVLQERHGVSPTHSLDEILTLRQLFPDRIRLFTGYVNGELAAGIVVFVCNSKALHTFYFAQKYEYQEFRVLNLLIYKIMEWGHDHGFAYLNLGISTEDNGKLINWGLFRFKEGFGGRGVVRRYYTLNLLENGR